MKFHMHIGDDSQSGKTLSALISLAILYRGLPILIVDTDTYGAKISRLLSPLAAIDEAIPHDAFRITNTQVYVVNCRVNDSLSEASFRIQEVISGITDFLRGGTRNFRFEHVIVDTNDSFVKYAALTEPLDYLDETKCLRFWINHNRKMLDRDYKLDFWKAHDAIQNYHHQLNVAFFHIFNPAGLFPREEYNHNSRESIFNAILSNNFTYRKLVEKEHSPLELPPERVIHHPTRPDIDSLDKALLEILQADVHNVGKRLAKLWQEKFTDIKNKNIVFVPVEKKLVDYRNQWDPEWGFPLRSIEDMRSRLGEVLQPSLVNQWTELLNEDCP